MATEEFKPALIVVDLQEDFCPPNGSLAVNEGRDVVPVINSLLKLPFAAKIATQDWHPANHISFAANHPGKEPFVSTCTVVNPSNAAESYETRLWPVHCVQDTPGAALLPELDVSGIHVIVQKGTDHRVEMYSAFYDPLKQPRVSDSGLTAQLRGKGITDVYVVGLAADYCVQSTAVDAQAEGFKTYLIEEGTRAVDPVAWEERIKAEVEKAGVRIVKLDSPEVQRLYKQ
ncbi:isochorismatase [Thozetella sp. PMI_491]|nr:isochorismatase [Thozetella sp. PMI_491]